MLDFYEQLRSAIVISSVVGRKVKLKRTGKEFLGRCPFHNEKTPSFSVSDQKGFYHCFGCQAHGDVVKFVSLTENLSYKEAAIKLADDYQISLPKHTRTQPTNQQQRSFEILEKICAQFEKNLVSPAGKTGISYLRKRGISDAAIHEFRLGFALNSFNSISDSLVLQGLSEKEAIETGVITKFENKKPHDRFRNRIIFPIEDDQKRVIAFGGRVLGDELPKYLNSAETESFKKGRALYNFANAKKAIFDQGYAVLVEGYLDVITLCTNGIKNVVAGLGTAFSEAQLQKIFSITDRLVVCLDADNAGVNAAKRISETALPLINSTKNVEFTFLAQGLDPDEFVKQFGSSELQKAFAQSIPLSEALLNFALIELDLTHKFIQPNLSLAAELRAKIEANLNQKLALVTDPLTKKYFSLFFRNALNPFSRKAGSVSFKNILKSEPHRSINPKDSTALEIISLVLTFPKLLAHTDSLKSEGVNLREVQFLNPILTKLKDQLIEVIDEGREEVQKSLLEKSPENKDIISSLQSVEIGFEVAQIKIEILLLKELSLQVEQNYQELVARIDQIETDLTEVTSHKIKEIAAYRNSLEQRISLLERELT